ncbi:HNH endonuclease [Sinorhizobium meliloti]|uniref:HNH endonuclease n=1 Tax=Rhizobium meliloti TaxID=382 RepID=UPI000FD4ED7F|nr:HNH endonuclease [Sinorhizobium meliloti]RVL48440.1 HNH endonuclease [Sinorhizobium meliloti]RVL72373.1 HNH endonuclease [Sinorhizobium meliloti]
MREIAWKYGVAFTDDEIVRFQLGTRKYGERWAVVDAEDWDAIKHLKWTVKKTAGLFYAVNSKGGFKFLHRVLMQPPPDLVVDHIDGDGLNNRRSNMQICTHGENFSFAQDRKRGCSYPDALLERWLSKHG